VALDNGKRVLGYFAGSEPPPIDAPVAASDSDLIPVFRLNEDKS
jgi:hypothetical protein